MLDATSATRPSWGKRLVGIEGLRAVAAMAVLIGHVQDHLARGVSLGLAARPVALVQHGLTLFFVLSGFLLFRPFASAMIRGLPRPPVRQFLANRMLRIFPAYVVIFLLASYVLQTTYTRSVDAALGVADVASTLGPITDPGRLIAGLTLTNAYFPGTIKTGLSVSWSLTAELAFYLLLPALCIAALRVPGSGLRRALLVPGALFGLGMIGKVWAEATLRYDTPNERFFQLWGANWHAVLERSIIPNADLFAYGCAAAVLFVLVEASQLGAPALARLRQATVAVPVLVLLLLLGPGMPGRLGARWLESVVAVGCAFLILAAALPNARGRATQLGQLLERAPLRLTGLVSYSVYLWHVPVLWWCKVHGLAFAATPLGFVLNVLLVSALTLALSALTYRYVERPALRLKRRTDVRRRASAEARGAAAEPARVAS